MHAAVLLLLLVSAATEAANEPVCTPEQDAAYEPYEVTFQTPGCDWLLFGTCSDACYAGLQAAVQHAPTCQSRVMRTRYIVSEMAQSQFTACDKARANTTNKYFPQVVPNAPKCSNAELLHRPEFTWKHPDCKVPVLAASPSCSDKCLAVIEDVVTRSPTCRAYDGIYTVAENAKSYLADCLRKRKEDVRSNTVLNTVVTVGGGESAAPSRQTQSTTAAVASVVAMLLVAVC